MLNNYLEYIAALGVRIILWSWLVMLGFSALVHPIDWHQSLPVGVAVALCRQPRFLKQPTPVVILGVDPLQNEQ